MTAHLVTTQPSSALIEFMNIGWFCFSSEGTILGANSIVLKLLDYPDQPTFLETNAWDLFTETVSRLQIQNSLKSREHMQELDTRLRCRDGRLIPVHLDIYIRSEEQDPRRQITDCLIKFSPDKIDEMLREFEQLQIRTNRQRKFAEALGRMIFSASALQDLPALLNLICREATGTLDVSSSQIWLLQEDALQCVASDGVESTEIQGLKIPLSDDQNSLVKVVHAKSPLYDLDVDKDGSIIHEHLKDLLHVHSILFAPLTQVGRILGVFVLVNIGNDYPVESEDLEFLLQLGIQAAMVVDNARLFENLKIANQNIAQAYDATLVGWAKALEFRDQETKGHTERVVELALKLSREFGLSEEELISVYRGALLHDIGKMAIPDSILLKKGPLTPDETGLMRLHPVLAYEMLKPIEYLSSALDIPYCHHEKWDGTGYPRGLKGEEIPFPARIFAVVDVWDALSCDRPYRKAWPRTQVVEKIQSESGKHFEPRVVDRFLEIIRA